VEKFFNPKSIVIFGLSTKKNNIPGYILQNTQRWGYKGKIFGVTPGANQEKLHDVTIYGSLEDLPIIPDLAVLLIPARFVPMAMEECGKFGITRAAVLASGFNELGESGEDLAQQVTTIANKYNMRFMGPNGLTVSDAHSGLCLPFIPHKAMKKGGFSFITQSGGLCLILWNLMNDENVGMAKFASIGNKLNIDEVDVLEYLGQDPQTKVIGLYLESIKNGSRLIETARRIKKPIIALKANTSGAGAKAAMSHTASLSNDDDIVNTAFEKAGIIRIEDLREFASLAKIFKLPPMRGNRLMIMTPGGGAAVMLADQCEKYGFEFADPGREFYKKLDNYNNAGVIHYSNPLDMGDIYDTQTYPQIFHDALSSDEVDGAIYGHALPLIPKEDKSIFKKMFYTDISSRTEEVILKTGKPLAMSVSCSFEAYVKLNANFGFPVYNQTEEVVRALRIQADFYARQGVKPHEAMNIYKMDSTWIGKRINGMKGTIGEEMLDVMRQAGLATTSSVTVSNVHEAVRAARTIGYPVIMKIDSPDILHKSDAGGVIVGIGNDDEAAETFARIITNARSYNAGTKINGVRIAEMAPSGHDMFIGAIRDKSFGPVVVFGYGGVYTEIFRDVERAICPSSPQEIEEKLRRLKCYKILEGARGAKLADISAFIEAIIRVSHLMNMYPEIKELDLNPVRIFDEGKGIILLDARARIEHEENPYEQNAIMDEVC